MKRPNPHTSSPYAGSQVWQVQLLGGLSATHGSVVLTHFGSRSVAALLARLALQPKRSHSREELIELLWPGVGIEAGRNRLRQALYSLRQLLEPPGQIAAPVVVADRLALRLVDGALQCDALQFESTLREGRHDAARALYRGELLPGFYDDWVQQERLRLAALSECIDDAHNAARDQTADVSSRVPPIAANAAAVALADTGRARLPLYLTRFFGSDAAAARLRDEVLAHRLVTLLGPGGSGKTRLAVELAASWRAHGLAAAGRMTCRRKTN